jgi:L-lactate dehydrogenase complex protein LldG
MSAFHKLIARVRTALERPVESAPPHQGAGGMAPPHAEAARRAELASGFAREFAAVRGEFIGIHAPEEIPAKVVELARSLNALAVAVGAGVTLDFEPIGRALEAARMAVVRTNAKKRDDAPPLRERIAQADLGVVEADAAIASTGTLAVVGTPASPASLTLTPPANLIIFHADRVHADLAAAIAALGPEPFVKSRVAMITGPSRTADIEKMIVLGVHGPRRLFAIAAWPR